jgi:hypothetical protein
MPNVKFSNIVPSPPGSVNDHIVGVKSGNVDALYTIADVVNFAATQTWTNIVNNFGAVGDGVTDNSTAFLNFQTFAQAQTNGVVLVIPPGNFVISDADASTFFFGIPDLTILGYGATLSHLKDDQSTIQENILGAMSYRLTSTNVGDTSVTMSLSNSTITFSAGNLKATANAPANPHVAANFAMGTQAQTTGKFYFEATLNTLAGVAENVAAGVCNTFGPGGGFDQGDQTPGSASLLLYDDGTIWQNNLTQIGFIGGSISAGQVISVAVDLTAKLGWVRASGGPWNGSVTANPATGVGGFNVSFLLSDGSTLNQYVCTFIGGASGAVTFNLGGSAYSFTAPAGFGNWGGTLNTNFPVNIAVGNIVIVSSIDMQGKSSFPPNWGQFEYHIVSAINTSTGVVTFQNPPLRYAHLSTFPAPNQYPTGNGFFDTGGPATIFLINQKWQQKLRIFGLTIGSAAHPDIILSAQFLEMTDCQFTPTSNSFTPTVCQRAVFTRCDFTNVNVEVDKEIELMECIDCDFDVINIASTSAEIVTFRNCSMIFFQDNAKYVRCTDCRIYRLNPNITFGQCLDRTYTNCSITSFNYGSTVAAIQLSDFSFSAGILSVTLVNSNIGNYWRFGIPGATCFFSDPSTENFGSPFQITSSSSDGTNLNLGTSLSVLPTYSGVTDSQALMLAAPNVTFRNCFGSQQLLSLSQQAQGLPYLSYGYFELTNQNLANIPFVNVIGSIVKLRVNVRRAYTGAQGTMLLHALSPSGATVFTVSGTTWTEAVSDPSFDLKVAGERIITATAVSGLTPNDTDVHNSTALSPFGFTWLCDKQNIQPTLSATMAGDTIEKWPIVEVELFTDQGVGVFSNLGSLDYLQEQGWHSIVATYTASLGEKIFADTTAGAFTITLPPNPSIGSFLKIYDPTASWNGHNLTLGRNGLNINSSASNYTASVNNSALEIIYINATVGWKVFVL